MDGGTLTSELKAGPLHMSVGDDSLRRSEGLSEQAPDVHITWSEGHFVNGQVTAAPAPGDAISDDEDEEDGLEMRPSAVATSGTGGDASQNGTGVEASLAAVSAIDKEALTPAASACGLDVTDGAGLFVQEAPKAVASLPASLSAPVEPIVSAGPPEHDAALGEASSSGDAMAEGAGLDTIDRLTAMEMLHLLKEYKKREFLYVSQISMLEQELLLKSNGSVACSPQPYEMNPDVFHSVSATQQLALLDPTVHLELRELRLKLYDQAVELQKTKDELKACTFSADSVMGRRLINKCKALQEENADLGKMVIETNLQPLQIQLGILQKQLAFFKQQLKVLYESNVDLEEENDRLTRQLQDMTTHYQNVQVERDALAEDLELLKQQQQEQQKKQQQRVSQEPGRVGGMRRQPYDQKQHAHHDHDRHHPLGAEGASAAPADLSERSRDSPGVTRRSTSGSRRRESSPLSQSSQYYHYEDHPMDGENGAVGVSGSSRRPSQQRHHYYRSRSVSIGKRHRHHRPESSNGKKDTTGNGSSRSSVVVSQTAEDREPRKNDASGCSVAAAATSGTSSSSSKRENRDAGRGRHHHHHHRQDSSGGVPSVPAPSTTQSTSSSFAYPRAEESRGAKKGSRKSQDRSDVVTPSGATKQSPERLRRTSSDRYSITGRLPAD